MTTAEPDASSAAPAEPAATATASGATAATATAAAPAATPTAPELLVPGTVILLTTVGSDGPRTRPVVLQPDPQGRPDHIGVLTGAGTRKVADLGHDPHVTVTAPLPAPRRGWFSLPGTVVVEASPDAGSSTARIDIALRDGRVWTIRSDAPFDNETAPLRVASGDDDAAGPRS